MREDHASRLSTDMETLAGIRPRCPLIHQESFGLGTATAESINSYFTRLASLNGFTPLQLIYGTNSAPITRIHPELLALQEAGATAFYRRATATSDKGGRFIGLLADLLGRGELNCLHWSRLFPGFALARFNRDVDAWCPDCLQKHKEPHGLMAWECSLVTACAVHGCWLETSCWQCGGQERRAVSKDFSRCRKCGADPRQGPRRRGVPPEMERTATLIGELIAFATSPTNHDCCSTTVCLPAPWRVGQLMVSKSDIYRSNRQRPTEKFPSDYRGGAIRSGVTPARVAMSAHTLGTYMRVSAGNASAIAV
jgi:hypothetical protein